MPPRYLKPLTPSWLFHPRKMDLSTCHLRCVWLSSFSAHLSLYAHRWDYGIDRLRCPSVVVVHRPPKKTLGQSKSNFIWSLHGMRERKFVQTVQATWPRWPPRLYMVKTLKKSSSPESKGRWPWKLVSSIECSITTKFFQMMTLSWPWPILRQGQILSRMLLYGKKVKQWIFQKLL